MEIITKEKIKELFVKDLEIEHFSEEDQTKIIDRFADIVLRNVTLAVIEKIPDDKKSELESLLSADKTEKLGEFLKENVDDIDGVVRAEVKKQVNDFRTFKKDLAT